MSDREFFENNPGASRGWEKYEEEMEQAEYDAWAEDTGACAVELCRNRGTFERRDGEMICDEHYADLVDQGYEKVRDDQK